VSTDKSETRTARLLTTIFQLRQLFKVESDDRTATYGETERNRNVWKKEREKERKTGRDLKKVPPKLDTSPQR
jgi:hypothetical protein